MTFAEEIKVQTETQGGGSQALVSKHLNQIAKDQVEPKSKAISSSGASDLEGCLKVPSGPSTFSGFDNTLTIHFNPPIL